MERLVRLFEDLKRRGVFRVAGIYAVAGWAIAEVAISVEEPLQLPGWLDTSVLVMLGLGFPIALVLAYAFDLTPDGLHVDRGEESEAPASATPPRIPNVVLTIALVSALGFIVFQNFGPGSDADSGRGEALAAAITDVSQPVPGYEGRQAIAVLPFDNMSGDPDQGYLADGIAEDLITALYSFKTIPVIARTSTFRYKDRRKDVREIAAELGAGYVLEGSVRRMGERVRVTAQLIDAGGEHIWAESYDRLWSEILEVHDEIIYSIVEAIEPELILSEASRRRHIGTDDQVAWDYYLRARALSGEEFSARTLSGVPVTMETTNEAWRLANKALEMAPDFAAAHALLSHIDGVSIFVLGHELGPEGVRRAIRRGSMNAARARSLDPFESTACACQVVLLLLQQDAVGAVEVGESALAENPGSAFVLAGTAKALQVAGDHERALELIQKAKRLSPKGISMPTYLVIEAMIRQSMGDMEGARRVSRQALLLSAERFEPVVIRITSLVAEGKRAEAVALMNELRQAMPTYHPAGIWPEPFPQALIDRMEAPLQSRLLGKSHAEGIAVVLGELGWDVAG